MSSLRIFQDDNICLPVSNHAHAHSQINSRLEKTSLGQFKLSGNHLKLCKNDGICLLCEYFKMTTYARQSRITRMRTRFSGRGVNAPQSLQAAETNVHKYKRRFYTIDGRIRV